MRGGVGVGGALVFDCIYSEPVLQMQGSCGSLRRSLGKLHIDAFVFPLEGLQFPEFSLHMFWDAPRTLIGKCK